MNPTVGCGSTSFLEVLPRRIYQVLREPVETMRKHCPGIWYKPEGTEGK
jgi:hypothetical protein